MSKTSINGADGVADWSGVVNYTEQILFYHFECRI